MDALKKKPGCCCCCSDAVRRRERSVGGRTGAPTFFFSPGSGRKEGFWIFAARVPRKHKNEQKDKKNKITEIVIARKRKRKRKKNPEIWEDVEKVAIVPRRI
jgi:hypothetical protein